MNDRRNDPKEPWEVNRYETGSTRPPKSRGGLIAVLLVAVILLCGISTALGVLNIRLGLQLKNAESTNISFSSGDTGEADPSEDIQDTTENFSSGDITVELSPTPGGVDNTPQEGGLSLQSIYEKNIPSVVSISCSLTNGNASGTGVVLSDNGYIVTNSHVVENATAIQVLFSDDRVMDAAVIGADPVSDLAVIRVNASDLTGAEFGDSGSLRVGDMVAAIGDPLGVELRGTMTDGIVSAINRDVTVDGRTMTLIQTNAALNSGNSGGPLLNCYGQVIGINTMKISAFVDSAGVEGLGFAIPSTTVKEIVEQLIAQGYVSGRPSLGIKGQEVTALEQRFYRLPAGILITEVVSGSAAETAGLQEGDILISINGQSITNEDSLNTILYTLDAGDTVKIIIYRNYKQYSAQLTLDEAK